MLPTAHRAGEFLVRRRPLIEPRLARSNGAAHRLGDPAPRGPGIHLHRAQQQTLDRSAGANSDSTPSTRSMPFVTVCRREAEDLWRILPHLPVWACRVPPCRAVVRPCADRRHLASKSRLGRRGRVSCCRSAGTTCREPVVEASQRFAMAANDLRQNSCSPPMIRAVIVSSARHAVAKEPAPWRS